jgi:uncharacterized protein (DUF433 family)
MTPDELVREWPHLSLAQIYDALSYYHDHQEEVERHVKENASVTVSRAGKR